MAWMIREKPPTFPLARSGAGPAPLRRPNSIRRTTSIESRWPDALGGPVEMVGRARDVTTPADGATPVTLASGAFRITASPQREILSIATEPKHPRDQELVGVRAGAASREALAKTMGDVMGAPIYQLIDDFAGASLVAGWIWMHWNPDLMRQMREGGAAARKGPVVNVCTGFAEGSSALEAFNGSATRTLDRTEVMPLENHADPTGWHEMLGPGAGPYMCRARRIDVWAEGEMLMVDAGFQDSGATPDGARIAVHEYRLFAALEAKTTVLRSLEVQPLILPFAECPGASLKASRMVGQPVGEFRQRVLDTLPYTDGCTHLNDVLRSLTDIAQLAPLVPA
jgi:hypothetical protein